MHKHPRMKSFCGNSTALKMGVDRALLTIQVPEEEIGKREFWVQSKECFQCSPMEICKLHYEKSTVLVNSTFSTDLFVFASNSTSETDPTCRTNFHFGEYGRYTFNTTNCSITEDAAPINSNLPILYSALVYLALVLVYVLAAFGKRKWDARSAEESSDDVEPLAAPLPPAVPKPRLIFLDVFRGLSIAIMIFVNYGGGQYWFFTHSAWNGLTVADLVFPWFMFIMGTSMAISFESLLRKATPRTTVLLKIARRSLILFALGAFVVNGNRSWSTFRVPGVLQRFAFAYACVGSLKALTATSAAAASGQLGELRRNWADWVAAGVVVVAQLGLTFGLRVPGCPTGYLGPGGIGDHGKYANCTGGAAGLIDRWFFGDSHIYQRPTARWLYNTNMPYDPEGLLGALNSVLIVFIGLQAGHVLVIYSTPKARAIRFTVWAAVCGGVAAVLTKGTQNEGWIPVNKNLWSLSFILALSSMAFLLLIALYFVVDVWKLWSGAPFSFVGMNSILLYVGHEVLSGQAPFGWADCPSTHAAQLAMNLWGASLWVVVAAWLHSHRFYLAI